MNEFTITINAMRILDFAAVGFMLFLTASAVRLMVSDSGYKGVGAVSIVAIALTIVALLANCAPATVSAPPTRARDRTSAERCVSLVAAACQHDAKCGGTSMRICLVDNASACVNATGLTPTETAECEAALEAEPCPGEFPKPCRGIMGGPPAEGDEVRL